MQMIFLKLKTDLKITRKLQTFILEAPEQYENESEMLTYFNNNPDATVKDLLGYFDKITPDGLPPCAFEWDDD